MVSLQSENVFWAYVKSYEEGGCVYIGNPYDLVDKPELGTFFHNCSYKQDHKKNPFDGRKLLTLDTSKFKDQIDQKIVEAMLKSGCLICTCPNLKEKLVSAGWKHIVHERVDSFDK